VASANRQAAPSPEREAEEAWGQAVATNTRRGYQSFLAAHGSARQADEARRALTTAWADAVPEAPKCRLASNLSVELSWPAVEGADGYEIQWSARKGFPSTGTGSQRAPGTFLNHKARRGAYGAKLPMYYRIIASGAGGASRPSEPCVVRLLPSEGGKKCQICGAPSVGYCHLRQIHVCAWHNTFVDDRGTNWRCP
jgi:hypothetical protein